tara:strand:- start:4710 stop:5954 length:1245 start_codon:yes stop_codon:yes gene_type:complete
MTQIKKRVLIVTQYFWPEDFRINELVRKLILSGYDVDIVTGRPNYPEGVIFKDFLSEPSKYNNYFGASIYRVKNIPRGKNKISLFLNYISFALLASIFLIRKFNNKKYNSIIAVQLSPIFSVIPALIYGKYHKVKVTTWVMDLWPDILSALNLVSNRFILNCITFVSSKIYKLSDALLISSEGFRNRLKDMGVNDELIFYFPQWVETIMETSNLSATNEYKKVEILLKDFSDKKKIVFTGNIGECQDIPTVLKAIKLVSDRKDFILLIIGSGREENRVSEFIKENQLDDHVKMLGRFPVEYMPSFYHFSEALLLPLAKDPLFEITLPGKTQSYLNAGRPIIGFLDGEGALVLKNANAGYTCNAGDYNELAKLISKFCDASETDLNKFGTSAKRYAEENFSYDNVMKTLYEVCEL